jgi:hypothetical protein
MTRKKVSKKKTEERNPDPGIAKKVPEPQHPGTDQHNLSSFMKKLDQGKKFEELDEDLRTWWINRY